MKIKSGLQYNEVCGIGMLIPVGDDNADFSNITSFNDSSKLLWKRMEQGPFTEDDLVEALLAEYDVDRDTAAADVATLLEQMRKANIIED